jgi:DNA-binding transcriptional ArsR family regulator
MTKRPSGKGKSEAVPRGIHIVTELAQIRALADPLRLKILGALTGVPRTTKQVAEVLGEKPTKLYHHVEALNRVGLVRLTDTRPNRGTTEKYFQAVADQFQVAGSALSPAESKASTAQQSMLTSILDTARNELLDCVRPGVPARANPDEAPLVARIHMKGSSRKVLAARRRLFRMIETLRNLAAAAEDAAGGADGDAVTCTFTVVFCPTGPEGRP